MNTIKTPYAKEMFMAFAGFSLFSIADTFIRSLNEYPTLVVICLAYSMTTLFLLLLSPFLGGLRNTLTQPQLKLRFLRGIVLACCYFLVYVALSNLDLTTTYALIFAGPFIAKILSIVINGENIRLRSWIITGFGFIGVLIVLRPGMVPMNIGALAAIGAAFFFGLGFVLTRYIRPENQTLLSMALFQYAIIAVCCAIPGWYTYQAMPPELNLGVQQWLSFLCINITGISGTILVSKAYGDAPTQIVAPIHYIQILWGALFSALFFSEYPDEWTIVGAVIIVFSGIALIKFSRPVA